MEGEAGNDSTTQECDVDGAGMQEGRRGAGSSEGMNSRVARGRVAFDLSLCPVVAFVSGL